MSPLCAISTLLSPHHLSFTTLLPLPHSANPLCLPLTLAQAAALLPGAIGIPEELLRFILYGDVEGVPDIWVVKIPDRQHLGKKCIIVQLECGISNCPPAKKCIEIKPVEAFKLLNSKYLQSHSVATSSKSVHLFISWMVYYLNNDLLLDAVSTVDPLNDMVRATVLDDSISYFDFPFKHADHKLSIKQELSTAIWYGWRETENNTSHTVLDPTETEWVVFRVKSNYRPLIGT